jgi:hypothetical protein
VVAAAPAGAIQRGTAGETGSAEAAGGWK